MGLVEPKIQANNYSAAQVIWEEFFHADQVGLFPRWLKDLCSCARVSCVAQNSTTARC